MDHRARRRNAGQELIAVLCLLLAGDLALLVVALVTHTWVAAGGVGLAALGVGLNVHGQLRRRGAGSCEGEGEVGGLEQPLDRGGSEPC